jgi:FixJ family two-component response regulator
LPSPPLIAIVDDDAAVRDALAELIEVLGFEARAFDSSESFLAAHAPGLFRCLITDLNLLGESGLQLRQRLSILEPSLPVIIISAEASPGARAQALRSGALAYLTKPITDQVLLRHLHLALATPQA